MEASPWHRVLERPWNWRHRFFWESKKQDCKQEVCGKSSEGAVRPQIPSPSLSSQMTTFLPPQQKPALCSEVNQKRLQTPQQRPGQSGRDTILKKGKLTDWLRVRHVTQTGPIEPILGIYILRLGEKSRVGNHVSPHIEKNYWNRKNELKRTCERKTEGVEKEGTEVDCVSVWVSWMCWGPVLIVEVTGFDRFL